jgi:hypothetical protein
MCYIQVYYIILLSKCQVNFLLTIYYRILLPRPPFTGCFFVAGFCIRLVGVEAGVTALVSVGFFCISITGFCVFLGGLPTLFPYVPLPYGI